MAKKKVKGDDGDHPQLPGTEDERDESLIRAAKRYRQRMLERKAAGDEEESAHESLLRMMHERGITSYRYKDLQVDLDTKEKVKVKVRSAEAEDDGGDE